MVLEWDGGAHASRYAVQLSLDGRSFRDARQVTEDTGGTDWIALPESEARHVDLVVQGGPGQVRRLRAASAAPPAFAATRTDSVRTVGARSPRALLSPCSSGEQTKPV